MTTAATDAEARARAVWAADRPYEIEHRDEHTTVVRYAAICDQPRTRTHDDELAALVSAGKTVICDLSSTTHMATEWLRWLARLSARARDEGTVFKLAGVSEQNRQKADMVGLADEFVSVKTIAEALIA